MEIIWKDLIRGAILGFVIPAAILAVVAALPGERRETAQATQTTVSTTQTQPVAQATKPTGTTAPVVSAPVVSEPEIPEPEPVHTIWVLTDDQRVEMELESYVVGVVLAEVPASFDMETLKAQAVAARTFALRVCQIGRHQGAVCTNYGCCQAFLPAEQYLQHSGTQEDLGKIRSAVEATAGEVLTYAGEVICATYFSCSGGSTEDAMAVWGSDVAYLQAVDSPGEEFASVFSDHSVFTADEFEAALCLDLAGAPESWFGNVTYTNGGGVDTMEIDGVIYRGTTLRTLLGLRSTVFTITVQDQQIHIVTRGYGHRVGMSQYGAEAMALSGADYGQILAHYYQGTILEPYAPDL